MSNEVTRPSQDIVVNLVVQESKYCSIDFKNDMTMRAPTSTVLVNPDAERFPYAKRNDTWLKANPFYMAVVFEDNFEDDITFTIREGFQELP